MSRLRSFAPAVVCLLVLLQLAGAVPSADAFDGPADDASSFFDGEDRGKPSAGDGVGSTRLSEEPVGLAAGRGFNPTGAVAAAFQVNCADQPDHWICNPDPEEGGGGDPDPTPAPTSTSTPTPTPTPTPDPRIAEGIAFDRAQQAAIDWINEQQFGFDIAPPARGQVVNLKNYMWIVGPWAPVTMPSETEEGIEVTITVNPVSSVWNLEEQLTGRTFDYHCDGPGHPYTNPDDVSRCGHTFDHSSHEVVGDVVLTTAVVYELTVVSSLEDSRSNFVDGQSVPPTVGNTFTFDDDQDAISEPFQFPLWVNEVLTWGIEEDGVYTAPVYNSDPIVPAEEGVSCGWREELAFYGATGVVGGLALNAFGIGCGDVKEVLILVKDGVTACLGGVVNSIKDTVELLTSAVTDPVGTVKDGIAGIQELIRMAEENPGEFATTVGYGLILTTEEEFNAMTPREQKLQVVEGICAVAFDILVGKASSKFLDLIPGRRPTPGDGTPGDTPEAPDRPRVCRIGGHSFPTGTQVRMSSGALVPIEHIEPGDYVLAADPTTGQWSSQLVYDQWSHLDTDYMATAALADGSTITATDHHLFWVESDQEWVELEDVSSGDLLLTPNGVMPVGNVVTHRQAETLVWELDTAGPDTFTVHTGTVDLLVHNTNCPSGNLSDRQRQDIDAGSELGDLDAVPPHRLQNLLRDFRTREIFDSNGRRFIIDKDAMGRILARHHPRYFDPANARTRNTAFDGSTTPDDIVGMMQQALRDGRPHPTKPNNFLVDIDGVTYELAIDPRTGRVADHFTPQVPGD